MLMCESGEQIWHLAWSLEGPERANFVSRLVCELWYYGTYLYSMLLARTALAERSSASQKNNR